MEIWGGIECTINRIDDIYLDQLDYSGHYNRDTDLNLFADLGISKMRYPVLWEKHQPDIHNEIDWSNTERRLLLLKELGIEPIAGLVHHGSGPAYVDMLKNSFAEGLAVYASKVAAKFPWINYYTPINEPLTTARFCGLYGIWYPHKSNSRSFVRILVNECKATVLAMQAIRTINPEAKLVQTEDLGKTHSTALLKYQAKFENNRRWLGFDLLCGKVTLEHPMWNYLIKSGLTPEELYFFTDNPCVPDIMGFNHYLTSERYLDENIPVYPSHTHGGNKRHKYADVEALRVGKVNVDGPYALLKAAWKRFKLPMAVTEVHLHCTREEQLRWFSTMWEVATKLKKEHVDISAVTAWAMLGSFGWNKLLTSPKGDYEAGIFDVLSGNPRPTALCKMIKNITSGVPYKHPVMEGEGWWNRSSSIIYYRDNIINQVVSMPSRASSPLIIIGKTGTLGNAFARVCKQRNIKYQLLGRDEINICNTAQIENVIRTHKPWAIINTAGFVRVDDAENESSDCFLINAEGPKNLAGLCASNHVKLMTFSSDLVFDGMKSEHYLENDKVRPLNIYGHSKALAEQYVLETDPSALIIRTSAFFGPWDQYNFVSHVLNKVKNKLPFEAANDVFISPTYVPDLANTSMDLLIDDERGIWHLANKGTLSWAGLASEVAERAGCSSELIIPVGIQELDLIAVRPKYSALKSQNGFLLPSLEDALGRFFIEQELIAI